MGEQWPEDQIITSGEAKDDMEWLIQVITEVRSIRAEMNIPPATPLPLSFYDAAPTIHRRIKDHEDLLIKLARLHHIKVFSESVSQKDAAGAAQVVIGGSALLISFANAIDVEAEKERLQKELKKTFIEIEEIEKKLSNQDFVSRAPQEVVETQQKRLEAAHLTSQKLEQALGRLL